MTKLETQTIQTVIETLEALATKGENRCNVADEHKEAVRLYVQSWAIQPLRGLLRQRQ